ncbi:zinc finger CCCH domain-containing protein 13-like [Diachasmimorpha longicaudata]|uniref:zinc finger CCCH domain-containing protein 13-like n=1 Tax=Diachasmimorpha longicaudata TaxID=58733 RepID=UPI0030B8860B
MLERRWLLLTLYGIFLAFAGSDAVKASRQKFKIATTSTTTQAPDDSEDVEATTLSGDVNATTGHTLTGIPQIDYIWDPNLPRELNGYNLSEYPFYDSIPKEIDFKCDGLHDGFYASVPHKCQVYHHCLYGTRYDFLCANFTAFDQKTFICHFASEVDCANSKKYWHRNDALYKAASTTPPPTPSTTTTVRTTTTTLPPPSGEGNRPTRRRRPFRRRPAYDYYEEDYYDDEFDRPRGRGSYDRRDDYDYEDRKYMRRDRERDRDREYRERDGLRRETDRPERPARDERDPGIGSPRERFHPRNNRRDPTRPLRDPVDEDIRPIRTRDPDDGGDDRGDDDRRHEKVPIKDDYDEDGPTAPSGPSSGDSLVKPAAPAASVYARPRTPPKIRRPVPLSEQDRFAYKATSVQPPAGDTRKRPTEAPLLDDDYYDDELEDIRPRRPMRPRRPYRERERTFYDTPRDIRDRERDRPFRSRYRDDGEEIRSRKHQDRPRERYYERSRDRALDRGKDRVPERESRPAGRRPLDREEKEDRVNDGRDHEVVDGLKESRKSYKHGDTTITTTTTTSTTTTTTTLRPETMRPPEESDKQLVDDDYSGKPITTKGDKPSSDHEHSKAEGTKTEEYSDDYYDEPEYPPSPPPRTAVRIVKRPFLPSRGGNPNPRGLYPVGGKAPESRKEVNHSPDSQERRKPEKAGDERRNSGVDDKRVYDAYKVIQTEAQQKRPDFDRPVARRPIEETRDSDVIQVDNAGFNGVQRRPDEDESERKPAVPWNAEEIRGHAETSSSYGSYTTEANRVDVTGPSGPGGKQRINEVSHQLQDIPESEYDVTLNEALTPSFNQESNLPSGFVLPLHRQLIRDPILQSSDNNYKISRPFNPQGGQQGHKSFVPSTQFNPLGKIPENDERPRSVQYYRTPEAHGGGQYRASRTPWHDYTGY